jgi:hypothetical protein
MITQWLADVPDTTPNSGNNNKIAVDAQSRVHLAFVSGRLTANQGNTLTYARGTPDGPVQAIAGSHLLFTRQYQWSHFEVVPSSQWAPGFPFDLAVDSQGKAHLCFRGPDVEDHEQTGAVKYAVFNEISQQFDITPTRCTPSHSSRGSQ